MTEFIHLGILGILCEKLGESRIYKPKVTLRPKEVTCQKCIEIMKTQGVFR